MRYCYRQFGLKLINGTAGWKRFLLMLELRSQLVLLTYSCTWPHNILLCWRHYDLCCHSFDSLLYCTPIKKHGTNYSCIAFIIDQEKFLFPVILKNSLFFLLGSLHAGLLEFTFNEKGTKIIKSSPLHLCTI